MPLLGTVTFVGVGQGEEYVTVMLLIYMARWVFVPLVMVTTILPEAEPVKVLVPPALFDQLGIVWLDPKAEPPTVTLTVPFP